MKKILHVTGIIVTVIICALALTPFNAALAAPTAVRVSAPASVNQGQQFTINVVLEPGTAIAGAQFFLTFNPATVTVNSVTEGNLLSQGGASTYFNSGTIDNVSGTISGVAGAITTPGQTVSTGGTFATIALSAGSSGTSPLTLSDVVVGDINGHAVDISIASGQVNVNQSQQNPGGGGGGGGGGGSSGATSLVGAMTDNGTMVAEVTAMDDEQKVKLVIHKGVTVKNGMGQRITSIRIKKSVESHAVNGDSAIISPAYDIQPNGTIFTPGATLVFKYTDSQLTGGIPEDNLHLALWNTTAGVWEDLGGTIDPAANTVSISLEHLSIYALMAHTAPASFELSDLYLSSTVAAPGDVIDISVLITNTGDLPGSYELDLKIDDIIAGTKTDTLNGGESGTVHFEITATGLGEHRVGIGALMDTFTVKDEPVPAAFTMSDLVITPEEIYAGDSVNISVRVTNTGELSETHHTALLINGVEVEARDIALAGGESPLVVFNIVAGAAGVYNVSIDDLHSVFSVLVPPPALPENTEPEISNFSITPVYDIRSRLTEVRLGYQLKEPAEQAANLDFTLKVQYEGSPLEEVSVFSPDGEFTYAPSSGWEPGLYSFRLEIYDGDSLVAASSQEHFSVVMEAIAAVVSWKTLGIIIGASLMLAGIAIIAILIRRRDMLRS